MHILKKTSKLLFIGLFIILVGCSKKPNLELNNENMNMVSSKIAEAFVNAEFKNIPQYLSKDVKEELTVSKLNESWMKATEDLGSYQSMKIELHRLEDRDLGYVTLTFKEGILRLAIGYDEEMKVNRLNLNTPSKVIEATNNAYYTEQNVLVGVDQMLNGILTLPVGVANPPIAILVQGSGPSNLNEEAYEMKPFEDIAHGLAEQGIATIRYDKRTYAYPEWDSIRSASLKWEYLYDFASVVHQIEDMPVNHNQIYLIGHSLGGLLAPRLAVEHPEIKGIISLAGTPRGLEEVIRDQQVNAIIAQGASEQKIEGVRQTANAVVDEVQALTKETATDRVISGMPLSYWYELNQSRAYLYIGYMKCDTLILQGESDFQVFYDIDYVEWEKLTAGMKSVQMRSYPGLSHFFTPAINNTIEDYNVPAIVDQKVIDDMSSWILTRKLVKE